MEKVNLIQVQQQAGPITVVGARERASVVAIIITAKKRDDRRAASIIVANWRDRNASPLFIDPPISRLL